MYLILITHCIVYTLISEFTSHFNLLYKSLYSKRFLCKYLYTDNTYGQKTNATALTKEIYEYHSLTKKTTTCESWQYRHVWANSIYTCLTVHVCINIIHVSIGSVDMLIVCRPPALTVYFSVSINRVLVCVDSVGHTRLCTDSVHVWVDSAHVCIDSI